MRRVVTATAALLLSASMSGCGHRAPSLNQVLLRTYGPGVTPADGKDALASHVDNPGKYATPQVTFAESYRIPGHPDPVLCKTVFMQDFTRVRLYCVGVQLDPLPGR